MSKIMVDHPAIKINRKKIDGLKVILSVTFLFLSILFFSTCKSKNDTPPSPSSYHLPPLPRNKPLRLVAFGDSTTAPRRGVKKVYLQRLQEKLQAAGIITEIFNAGVPGDTTEDARLRLRPDVLAHQPHLVIIQFGLNDAAIDFRRGRTSPWVSLDRYKENLRYFIETLLNRQIYVLLMTPNPMRWTHHLKRIFNQAPYNRRFPRGINVLLRNYAWAVRNLSREFSLPLVDVFRLLETREINGEGEVNSLLSDGIHPNDLGHELIATWLSAKIKEIIFSPQKKPSRHLPPSSQPPGFQIPIIDLSRHGKIQVVVDKENGQYLGHPTTVLLEDGRTIIVVYPKGHGRGAVVMKKSSDGGRTWSPRLPVPSSWATSREVPTIFRTIDSTGKKRLILFSGLYPIRMSISEDDGLTWSELKPIGPFGGIVAMASCIPLRTGPGHYLAMFHDDGRFIQGNGQPKGQFTLYQCFSEDGGLTWSAPQPVYSSSIFHLCEAGLIRSPDGRQIAALLRENSRRYNSLIILSNNEGKTWSAPRELPGSLTGDRHTGKYLPDGRLFISFRDISPDRGSPTEGDWVAWVGNYDDLVNGREGQYRLRLMDNHHAWDCGYPGVEILPNGTIVAVSYGHWQEEEPPYIVAVRFKLRLADRIYKRLTEKNN